MEHEKVIEEKSEQLKDRPIVFRPADNFTTYYTNSAQFQLSFYDIGIVFGQIKEASEERLLIENQFAIMMSPQHAKALLRALKANVEKYESLYGPIKELEKEKDL